MANILNFEQAFQRRNDPEKADLNQLLKRASAICQEKLDFSQGKFGIVEMKQIKNIFESHIAREIFNRNLIGRDVLLCGIYVSNLLTELMTVPPKSWWAVDYSISENPSASRKGGDVCFIICGIFPERGNYRLMDTAYYRKMGASFYFKFYGLSRKEIGYYMSRQFEVMVEIVQSCLKKF